MDQQQRDSHSTGPLPGTSISAGTYVAEVETVDGNAVQMEVRGIDTVADVRKAALAQMGQITQNPDKYFVMTANDRVLDGRDSVDQVLAEGETLNLRLIPQATFGPAVRWLRDG